MMKLPIRIFCVLVFSFGCIGSSCASNIEEGLWVWKSKNIGDNAHIKVTAEKGKWNASFNDIKVAANRQGSNLRFDFSANNYLLVKSDDSSDLLQAYFFQAETNLDYQNVITPITLPKIDPQTWGKVATVQNRPFHIFLEIIKQDNETYTAVIRNPEGNNVMRANQFLIEHRRKNRWALKPLQGNTKRTHSLHVNSSNSIKLHHNFFDEPLTLRPATIDESCLYYSKNESSVCETVRSSQANANKWEKTRPEDVGMNPFSLKQLTAEISEEVPSSARPRLIHSLLIAKGDALVYEEYFYGYDREKRHDVRSLGKVFGSILLGALKHQGKNIPVNYPLVAEIYNNHSLKNSDKQSITLHHALTYTTGLDCDSSRQSKGSESAMWRQTRYRDYWWFTANLPLLHEPGKRYAYCSGSANLVGFILNKESQQPIFELFDSLIAKPLNYGPYHWPVMPNGEGYLGGGMYMRPIDILKLGVVYNSDGKWEGQQIIAPDWIEQSTKPAIEISKETTGTTQEVFEDNYLGGEQAYIWRVDTLSSNGVEYSFFEATGNGGQYLVVVPELELSIVITGGNYRMGYIWNRWRSQLIEKYIIPSVVH